MDATLTDCQIWLARDRFERYSDGDHQRNWYEAENEMVSKHAYFRSLKSIEIGANDRATGRLRRNRSAGENGSKQRFRNASFQGFLARILLSLRATDVKYCPTF